MQSKKLYSIIFLPLFSLYADTCYSVELWSVKAQNYAPQEIENECQDLKIGGYIASRCGCFENRSEAKKKLKRYRFLYPNAYVTKTLRSRFKTQKPVKKMQVINSTAQPVTKEIPAIDNTLKPVTEEIPDIDNTLKPVTEEILDLNSTVEPLKEVLMDINNIVQPAKKEVADINSTFRFEATQDNTKNLLERREDIQKLSQNNDNLNSAFGQNSSFYGLSLEGKYEQYLNQDYINRDYTDYEYGLKLKFSLLKNGFFEHQKENKKEKTAANVTYLQNLSVVLQNSAQETKLLLESLENEVNYRYYTELSELYKGAMQKSKAKLDEAVIQSYRYDLLEQMYKRFLKSSKVFERHPRVAMDKKLASLMNEIGSVKLKEKKEVITYCKEHNYDISLQNAKIKVLDEPVSYLDNVTMDLYAHRREVDELGWYNTVGAEAIIPLDLSSNEEASIQKLSRSSNEIVNKSLEANIQKRVESLYQNFTDLQAFISIDNDDIKATKKRVIKFKEIKQKIIPNLNFYPDEEVLKAQKEIVDLELDIQLTKVKLLKILTEIAEIGNIQDISQIIKPKSEI